jgi:hypothetical protein
MRSMPDDVDELLRAARPEPRAEFVRELEARLLARRAPRRPRTLALGLACAVALAATVLVLGVAGALPLHLSGDEPATATDECETVLVQRTERRPVLVVTRAGELRVRYRTAQVQRPVKRCR